MKTRIIIYSFVFNSCIRGDQIKKCHKGTNGGRKEEEEEMPQMKTRIIIYSFVFNSCIRGDQIKKCHKCTNDGQI
ncbi:MAG: hypothetical protein JNL65_07605 [Saprospiraceae bacterium]|nr:hypothetical protein [Saprospiraceae bacterium]